MTLLSGLSVGQTNFVSNSSFETYTACAHPLMSNITNWASYFTGSSDAFNICITPTYSYMGVPSNIFGFESPHSGNGYCGFGTYEVGFSNAQEFLRTKLTSTLVAGKTYSLTFFVSLSDSSSYETTMFNAYFSATDDIISDDDILRSNAQVTITVPHNSISKIGWTKISATYSASGTEEYLMLGNFQKNNQVDTLFLCNCQFPKYSYYFIDDVSLYDIDELSNISEFQYQSKSRQTLFKNSDVFEIPINENIKVFVYDQLGKLLLTKNESFSLTYFTPGIYYYLTESGLSISQGKIIITE